MATHLEDQVKVTDEPGHAIAHRATADEGLDGAHEAPLQVGEPRHVRRHALPRYPQQLAVHKLRLRTLSHCDAHSSALDLGLSALRYRGQTQVSSQAVGTQRTKARLLALQAGREEAPDGPADQQLERCLRDEQAALHAAAVLDGRPDVAVRQLAAASRASLVRIVPGRSPR